MKKDMSGLQSRNVPPGYFRGAVMGGSSMTIGTEMPPETQIYDCCNEGYNHLSPGQIANAQVWNSGLSGSGFQPFYWWQQRAGWSDFCSTKPGEGQPNPGCPNTTAADPDLMCTFLEKCGGASCPPWKGGDCPQPMTLVNNGGETPDVGGESIANWNPTEDEKKALE